MAKRELKWMPLLGWFSTSPLQECMHTRADWVLLLLLPLPLNSLRGLSGARSLARRSEPLRRGLCRPEEQQGRGKGDECRGRGYEETGCT